MTDSATSTPPSQTPPVARRSARRWWPYLAALAGLGLLYVLLVAVAGARFQAATVALVLVAGALLFSLRTLFRMAQVLARPSVTFDLESTGPGSAYDVRELREERRRLLRAINELKFDFDLGKLSESDYREVREGYELKTIEIMRALEQHQGLDTALVSELRSRGIDVPTTDEAPVNAPSDAPEPGAPEEEMGIESSIHDTVDAAPPKGVEPLRPTLAVCEACQGLNDADARFCKHCGVKLK